MKKLPKVLSIVILLVITAASVAMLTLDRSRAPDISFPLLDGRELSLSSLSGRPVLVTFWATTCVECRKEMPELMTMYRELSVRGFEMIAVAMPYDPPNRVLELSEQLDIPYPIALDIEGKAVRAFGDIPGTPAAFLISPEGHIVMRYTGALDLTALREKILSMLQVQNTALHSPVSLSCNPVTQSRNYPCSG